MQPHVGALLTAMARRCGRVSFGKTDHSREAMIGLLELRAYVDRKESGLLRPISHAFVRLCQKDPALVGDVLVAVSIDATTPSHGRRASLLTQSLPKFRCDEAVWAKVVEICVAGLRAGAWGLHDLRVCVSQIAYWGAYTPSLPDAVAAFVGPRLTTASPGDLPVLLSILTSLPETTRSPLMNQASQRVVALADVLTPAAIGHVCGCFNKSLYTNGPAAAALQTQAIRFAEECDLYSAIQLFCLVASHEVQFIDTDAIKCLVERIVESEGLDVPSVMALCKAVRQIPRKLRPELTREMQELVAYLSRECEGLLQASAEDGGLGGSDASIESLQQFVSRFLSLAAMLKAAEYPSEFTQAVSCCAAVIKERVEDIVSAENPPFSLIPHLFEVGTPASIECAAALMHEAAAQGIHFPALQTYRFLLALGDHQLRDKLVYRHLRNQFSQTSAGIPMIQLAAALKCFARGLELDVAEKDDLEKRVNLELEAEEMRVFLAFCEEKIQKGFSDGMDTRCVLACAESMAQLGYNKPAFFDSVAEYMNLRCAAASPEIHNAETAANVLSAMGEQRLERFPAVRVFLTTVTELGTHGEEELTPSEWMNLNDPANAILPLTEEQRLGWDVLEKMRATRAADAEALSSLAMEYLTFLPFCRPDDLKYFFAIFEEKVLKNDKILKQCLDHLVSLGVVTKLSGYTIASILHSLAGIKFAYYGSTKKFMLAISEEQWGQMEASALVQITAGMAKLSLRLLPVLLHIGERLVLVSRFLTPLDTAVVINALQSLGFHDEMVLSILMQRAASSANRFDEVALTMLFGSQSIHRLLNAPETSQPLLQRAIGSGISPHLKQRIVASVRRSALPRDLIQSTVNQMGPLLGGSTARSPLQLESS